MVGPSLSRTCSANDVVSAHARAPRRWRTGATAMSPSTLAANDGRALRTRSNGRRGKANHRPLSRIRPLRGRHCRSRCNSSRRSCEEIGTDRRVQAMASEVDGLLVDGDRTGQTADVLGPIDDNDREAAAHGIPGGSEPGGSCSEHDDVAPIGNHPVGERRSCAGQVGTPADPARMRSMTAMLATASSGGMGTSVPSRTAAEKASH